MAKNGFVKKNVGTLTLGERLNKIRSERRINLSEASRITKIQVKYLEYLENSQYDKLPANVYVKGFLRSYAQYLGADEGHLIKLYEREREIHNNVKKEPKKDISRPLKFSSLVISPKILVSVLIIFFIGLGFFYLYRELSIFISNPRLIVLEPNENFIVENRSIAVVGITEKDAKLLINNQSVIVDENGKFSEEITLQPGLNTIVIKSVNRFEKQSEKIITGEAKFQNIQEEDSNSEEQLPEPENQTKDEENSASVKIEIYGDTKPVFITVKTDDEIAFSGTISPGVVKSFEAKNEISISAEKGKYAGVKLNGQELGLLSKDTKPITRVFTSE